MLTLIVVSYNSSSIINRCLHEIISSGEFPVLLIDNASPDGSAAILSETFPNAEIVAMDQNIGYGRAANVGLHKTGTPYALLLNPDLTATVSEIKKLLAHAQNDRRNNAIWGPATERKYITGKPPKNVKWVSGSAMLFDVEKIKKSGLFDENIFLFSEETDLCERTLSAGYKITFCGDVFFDHLIGQASPFDPQIEYMKWWHFGWSQCYRMTKHNRCTCFQNPRRKHLSYRFHTIFAFSSTKRKKWRAKADGAKAFVRGEKAFDEMGIPKRTAEKKDSDPPSTKKHKRRASINR